MEGIEGRWLNAQACVLWFIRGLVKRKSAVAGVIASARVCRLLLAVLVVVGMIFVVVVVAALEVARASRQQEWHL